MGIIDNPKLNDIINSGKVLLINAPAVDIRIPWSSWQQPLGLLQIGTALKLQGCDVRLIDCLQTDYCKLARTKVDEINIDSHKITLWQFGLSPKEVASIIHSWMNEDWFPEIICISCGLSCWWRGARNLVTEIRKTCHVPIILGGPYATAYPNHAEQNVDADLIITGQLDQLEYLPTDFRIYSPLTPPKIAGIKFFAQDTPYSGNTRSPEVVIEEIIEKCKIGVNTFIWYDDFLTPKNKNEIATILEGIILSTKINASSHCKPKMVAPGNLSPQLIDKDIAELLYRANFRNISLHDDMIHFPNNITYLCSIDDYILCKKALISAGFHPRYGEIDAALMIGLPGENIEHLTKRMILLASIIGSIHLVPFQYTPGVIESMPYTNWLAKYNGHYDLDNLNGKLFPLARISGYPLSDYWDLTRLMALLNSKFHSETFDFLGDSITAEMVQKSLRNNLWDPFFVREKNIEVNR